MLCDLPRKKTGNTFGRTWTIFPYYYFIMIFIVITVMSVVINANEAALLMSTPRPPTPSSLNKNATASPSKTSSSPPLQSRAISAARLSRNASVSSTTTTTTTQITSTIPGNNNNNNQYPSPQLLPYQYVKAGRLTDEQRLMIKLFTNYDRFARPVKNMSDAITIKMSLTITQIFELDEKNQVLITNAWANFEWCDEYMRWAPEEFSNMVMVRMLSSKLWLPDIVLYNNAADFSPSELSTRAMVSYDGWIFWSVPSKFFSSCKIDVTYFPFDEQICKMKFGSWTWDGFKLDLINSSTTADLAFYVKSGEWDLISAVQLRNVVIYSCCVEPYPDVTFYIHIRRKSLYYFLNVFIPCFLMSGLTLLVFLLPVESGEKCGLGITIMLSFAVFMLTVIEKLPETSESFPLISIYLTVVLSMTAISLCCTVFVLTFNYRSSGSAPLPRWMKRFLGCVAPVCCVHSEKKDWLLETTNVIRLEPADFLHELSKELNELANSTRQPNSAENFHRNFMVGINRIVDRHLDELNNNATNADWHRLAQFIDRTLFWILLFAICSFTVYILVFYAPAVQLLEEYK